jgi:hypothetical protein
MRGLRTFSVALLVSALSIPLYPSSAMAFSYHRDPDDTETSFDIRAVRTISNVSSPAVILSATTFEVLQWSRRTSVWFYIDSRSGGSYDFLVTTSLNDDQPVCDLYSRDSFMGRVPANFGPRRVTCHVKKRFLRKTHSIRYNVRAISRAGGEQVNDRAPDGFGNWYPHT